MYTAKDDFSENLLKSIPKKVVNWLAHMQVDLVEPFHHETLSVSGDLEEGFIKSIFTTLQWIGNPNDPDNVYISDPALADIKNHLEEFVKFEQSIYNVLQKLQDAGYEKSN